MTPHPTGLLLASLALCAACSGEPVTYSAPVGIQLKVKSTSAMGGVVADEKAITTEAGNPYGAFIAGARARIGRDPALVDVERVELALDPASTGVAALGDVFAGAVDLSFRMNETNNAHRIATGAIDAASAAGPIDLAVVFAAGAVPDLDYVRLLLGSFKVVARGPAAPAFEARNAEADLVLTVTFAAFE